MTGLPPTSPFVVQFGRNGQVFTATIRFNNATGALQNIQLDRSVDAVGSSLTINGQAVGTVTPGGTLTLSGATLAGFGLNVFTDIGAIGLV